MWPGRARSCGRVAGSMKTCTVRARSGALMPVVVPVAASTLTVKWVPRLAVLRATIGCRSSSTSRSGVAARQTRPRPCLATKLIAAGVTRSAAIMKSPSFSRSSSSTTMINSPRRRASSADSMVSSVP